jgi:hypothetical protein
MSHAASPRRPARALALQAAILTTVFGAIAAHAEPSPALDRVSVSVGGFIAKPKIHADGDSAYGYLETPEAEGGHTTLPRIKADVLLGDSQGISLDYFRYDKDYNPKLSGATTYQGQPISGNADVYGNLRLDVAQLAYRWWIGHQNDVFGIGVGAAYLHARVEGSVSGQVSTQGDVTVGGFTIPQQTRSFSGSGSASENGFAPLVELGWRHSFRPDLRMYAEASGIKKNGGNVDGHIYGGAAGVEWLPTRNVGVVLDYGVQKVQLSRNGDRRADLDLRLTGPSAYVKLRF